MSKYKMISPAVPNVPWQEGPETFTGAPVWRYSENPVIGRNPLKNVARIFNSAVMPYEDGFIGVFRGENIHSRTAELGYYIGEPYWGKGYAASAVKQVCQYVFANTDILRIFAEPFAYNAASRRVLEKAGFQLEGILRRSVYKLGETQDSCMYSLLREEA